MKYDIIFSKETKENLYDKRRYPMYTNQSATFVSSVQQAGILQNIDVAVLEQLSHTGKLITLSAKKSSQEEFQIRNNVYLLIDGKVLLSCINQDGKKIITEYLEKGDFFGDLELFGDGKRKTGTNQIGSGDKKVSRIGELIVLDNLFR